MRVCTVEDCDRYVHGWNLCLMHYKRWRKHGDPLYCATERHGMSNTKVYVSYIDMKRRCSPTYKRSHRYYDRGITICEEWLKSFDAFYNDMGDVPFEGAELDRINNDKGYSKENCQWATRQENAFNISTARGTNYHKRSGKWRAQIMFKGELFYLGLFKTEKEARAAYVTKATQLGRII